MNYAEFYKQMSYRARFEWGYDGIKTHGQVSDILVIIDVLSFTTCVDVVLGQGGIVYPYRTKGDSALAFACKQDAILAGKRGEPISSPCHQHPSTRSNGGAELFYHLRMDLPALCWRKIAALLC